MWAPKGMEGALKGCTNHGLCQGAGYLSLSTVRLGTLSCMNHVTIHTTVIILEPDTTQLES